MAYKFASLDVTIPHPGLTYSHLRQINDNGVMVAEGRSGGAPNGDWGAIYDHGSTSQFGNGAGDIDNNGNAVGFVRIPTGVLGLSGDQTIEGPNGKFAFLSGTNDAGVIVGTYGAPGGGGAGFKLTDGVFSKIKVPGSESTIPTDINNNNQKVGFYSVAGAKHGFLLDHGHYKAIDAPGARNTAVEAIDDNGRMVGAYQDAAGLTHGFLRSAAGVFKTFDVPGAVSTSAYGINSDGDVVGSYLGADNHGHSFVASKLGVGHLADLVGHDELMQDLMPVAISPTTTGAGSAGSLDPTHTSSPVGMALATDTTHPVMPAWTPTT